MEKRRESVRGLKTEKLDWFLEKFYKYGLYVVFICLVLFFTSRNSNFFSFDNGRNLLQQTASSGIAAAGIVFVMLTGGIDISISSVMFITAVISAMLTDAGLGFGGALLVSLACGAAVGCINGFLVAKLHIMPLIVTLAMQYVVRGVAIGIVGIQTLFFNNEVGKFIVKTQVAGVLPLIVFLLLVIMALGQFLLSKTWFGKQVYAVGNNKLGAEQMGIKTTRIVFLSYVICGALAGLAGLVSGAQVGGISPTFATGQEFIIISSVVLGGVSLFGGKGTIFPNAFLGVLIMMCIENGLVMARTNMYAYTIVRGCVIFVAVLLDSIKNRGETR
ncbi:MAG: ABC transporter permease [Lachnospiraceae bacterium]|nr:ABC transporter permease [Lachnospiraceae bacterium]